MTCRALRLLIPIACLLLPILACGGTPAEPSSPPPVPGGWTLSWQDEFDSADGSSPDSGKWTIETGGRWYNNESQAYTARPQNVTIQGGKLVITALKETYTAPEDGVTREFTSARLKTQGKFEQAYGRIEGRIKVPFGQGMWPAFWMLGSDIDRVGWPACGEIDIMENIGKEPAIVHGTVHGPGYSGAGGIGAAYTLSGGRFADDFHLYAIEWEPNALRFYVDGSLYFTLTTAKLPAGSKWVFDHPFFLIVNLAVGGDWPGYPDATTTFPQRMEVDWVRVYTRK